MIGQAVNVLNQVSPNWLSEPVSSGPGLIQGVWSVVWATAVVLALILLGGWFLHWVMKKAGHEEEGRIKVLHRFYLSPKHSLVIVNVEGRRLLLGVAENGINFICELGRDNKFYHVIQEVVSEQKDQGDFVKELETQIQELKSAIRKRING